MSGPADNDKRFEHVLTSILREDPGSSRQNCPHPGLLSAYFESKLTKPETRELELHLSGCNSCQAELAALLRLQSEPAIEGTPAEPAAAPAVGAQGEPSPEAATKAAPAEAFTPKRRRTLWNWVAPLALAASAVLAISVTYRFSPLIDQAFRRSRESGVGAKKPENASLAAGRDEDASVKEAPQAAPAAPTTAASPPPPPEFDATQGGGSESAPADSALLENAATTSPGQRESEPQTSASPTALAPPAALSAPPEEAARTKQASKDQLAAAPANQGGAPAFAEVAKLASQHALVIVARTGSRCGLASRRQVDRAIRRCRQNLAWTAERRRDRLAGRLGALPQGLLARRSKRPRATDDRRRALEAAGFADGKRPHASDRVGRHESDRPDRRRRVVIHPRRRPHLVQALIRTPLPAHREEICKPCAPPRSPQRGRGGDPIQHSTGDPAPRSPE